jgi:parallel beta-helix repeat protein
MNPTLRRLGMLVPLAALLLVPTAAQAGSATTRWVDDDGKAGPAGCDTGTAAAATIQAGVNAAAPGDTVRVCPGTYREIVVIPATKDGLTLTATARAAATLVLPEVVGEIDDLVTIDGADGVTVRWLRFLARKNADCDTIGDMVNVIGGQDVTVRGIVTRGPAKGRWQCGSYGNGITFRDGASGLAAYNSIVDFEFTGIRVRSTAGVVTVLRNSIRVPQATAVEIVGGGIGISVGAAGAHVLDNVVSGTDAAPNGFIEYGISVSLRADNDPEGDWLDRRRTVVRGNTANLTLYGVFLESDVAYPEGTGGKVVGNTVAMPFGARGVYLQGIQRAIVRGNTATGYDTGIWMDDLTSGGLVAGNTASGSATLDCYDASTGSGTAGTANTWTNNTGVTDNDTDLCSPPAP